MTKRHFIAFAEEIGRMPRDTQVQVARALCCADLVAKIAAQFNPDFSRERFYDACGLSGMKSREEQW